MKAQDCIFFQLAKASQTGVKFWSQIVASFGVTAVQAMVLGFLHEADQISSRELGERTQLDSATLTGVLDRLESGGLIERTPNPADRRAIRVVLTTKGKATTLEMRTVMEEANAEFLHDLSDQERQTLRELLGKIRSAHHKGG